MEDFRCPRVVLSSPDGQPKVMPNLRGLQAGPPVRKVFDQWQARFPQKWMDLKNGAEPQQVLRRHLSRGDRYIIWRMLQYEKEKLKVLVELRRHYHSTHRAITTRELKKENPDLYNRMRTYVTDSLVVAAKMAGLPPEAARSEKDLSHFTHALESYVYALDGVIHGRNLSYVRAIVRKSKELRFHISRIRTHVSKLGLVKRAGTYELGLALLGIDYAPYRERSRRNDMGLNPEQFQILVRRLQEKALRAYAAAPMNHRRAVLQFHPELAGIFFFELRPLILEQIRLAVSDVQNHGISAPPRDYLESFALRVLVSTLPEPYDGRLETAFGQRLRVELRERIRADWQTTQQMLRARPASALDRKKGAFPPRPV